MHREWHQPPDAGLGIDCIEKRLLPEICWQAQVCERSGCATATHLRHTLQVFREHLTKCGRIVLDVGEI